MKQKELVKLTGKGIVTIKRYWKELKQNTENNVNIENNSIKSDLSENNNNMIDNTNNDEKELKTHSKLKISKEFADFCYYNNIDIFFLAGDVENSILSKKEYKEAEKRFNEYMKEKKIKSENHNMFNF